MSPADKAILRAAVTPHLDARDDGTRLAVLLGDAPALALGYDGRGIPECAGLRLAASEVLLERDPIASLLG